MPSSIIVRFAVGGVSEIERGFRTVQQAADRLDTRTRKLYSEEEKLARQASKEKEREVLRLEKATEQSRRREERDGLRLVKDSVKAHAASVDEKLRSEDRWAKQRARIQENSAKLAFRLADEEVRAAESAEKRKAATRDRFARATGGQIGSSLGGMARGAVGLAGSALALGGGFGIADVVQQRFALERSAALFSNSTSSMSTGRISTNDIMSRSRSVGIANNVDPAAVAASMQMYFARASDAPGAMKNAGLFAQLSKATGQDMSTIADTAGSLRVQNPNLDEAGMKNLLMGLVGQTRKGSVDIRELAQYVPVITGTSGLYAGDQSLNQQKLIGLSQVTKPIAGGAAEAATAVKAFSLSMAENSGKIQGATGYSVKDSKGNLKDPTEIIAGLMQATGGDAEKLKKAGINREALTPFLAEMQNFKGAGGGKAGADAVRAHISQFTEGGYDEKSLAADVANVASGPGEKFEAAAKRVSDVIQEKLAPYMESFADKLPEIVPKVEKVIDVMASLADFFMENPFKGIGAVVLAKIAGDIVAAQIGEGIKSILTKSLSGGGGGGGGGAAGALVPLALFGGMIEYGINAADKEKANQGREGASLASADVKSLTPEQIEVKKNLAMGRAASLQTELDTGLGKYAQTNWGDEHKGAQGEAEASMKYADMHRQLGETKAYLEALNVALKNAGATAPGTNASPVAPNRNQPISGR